MSEANRGVMQAAASHDGTWRDAVLFVCTVTFTVVWWDLDHGRETWLPVFIVLLLLIAVSAYTRSRADSGGLPNSSTATSHEPFG